jgi:hypothetical protein
MLKQTIKFRDLDDNEIEDVFYFNLNKGELGKMLLTHVDGDVIDGEGDPTKWIQEIIDSRDGGRIIDLFEMFVKASYGVRSENNRRFIKSEEAWLDFYQSDAYSEFFFKLCTDAEFGGQFISGLMPQELQDEVKNEMATLRAVDDVNLPEPETPPKGKRPQDMTKAELLAAYQDKLNNK